MENKTAEEVFEQYTLMHNLYGRGNKNDIIAAMIAYAQQQSIGFVNEMVMDGYEPYIYKSVVYWNKDDLSTPITTSDLYQIYSQQKGK